ncbi:peptidylprolyl isomerase fpr4 [Agyrium rufum]|nr:peptidylprolyl isomerase fpr4 [Agyrium rufum]
MAAIDPSATPEFAGPSLGDGPVRATLKLIRELPADDEDDEDDEGEDDQDDELDGLLNGADSDGEDSDTEGKHGGPSDPSKSKKAQKAVAMQKLKAALQGEGDDAMDEDEANGVNGSGSPTKKGKAKASPEDSEEDSEDLEDDLEEFVVCTLDPEKHYQQTLDITIGADEEVYFKVSGTHTIYLTGNYIIPADEHEHDEDDEEDDEYDLEPDLDELEMDEESDELDDIEDPRIVELNSDEEEDEAPKLIKKAPAQATKEKKSEKGKNKRAAEESDEEVNLDNIISKSLKPEPAAAIEPAQDVSKLSKKQQKKLKNNAGKAVDGPTEAKETPKSTAAADTKSSLKVNGESPATKDKKVQFAKNLEQGPTASNAAAPNVASNNTKEADIQKDAQKLKASLGVKTVQGVTIDDRRLGTGPAAKKGSRVSLRYIGKLEDGKVFDSNKKGKPFSFKIGSGEVIQGWEIGVQGMTVGSERKITIPPQLAYGSKKQPGIPANSKLVFDLKCLEIK